MGLKAELRQAKGKTGRSIKENEEWREKDKLRQARMGNGHEKEWTEQQKGKKAMAIDMRRRETEVEGVFVPGKNHSFAPMFTF